MVRLLPLFVIPLSVLGATSIAKTWSEKRPEPCGSWADVANTFLGIFYPNMYMFHGTGWICEDHDTRVTKPPYAQPCKACETPQYYTEFKVNFDMGDDPDGAQNWGEVTECVREVTEDVSSLSRTTKCTPVKGIGAGSYMHDAVSPWEYLMDRLFGDSTLNPDEVQGAIDARQFNKSTFPDFGDSATQSDYVFGSATANAGPPITQWKNDATGKTFVPPLFTDRQTEGMTSVISDHSMISVPNDFANLMQMSGMSYDESHTYSSATEAMAAKAYDERGYRTVDYWGEDEVNKDVRYGTAYYTQQGDEKGGATEGHKRKPAPLTTASEDFMVEYIEQNLMGADTFTPYLSPYMQEVYSH